MAGSLARAQRVALIDEGFRLLPGQYLGAERGFDATYQIRLRDLGQIWEVRCTARGTRVRRGASRRVPDVTITTDSDTWTSLRRAELSGVEALGRGLIEVRGHLDHAIGFEGLFRRPDGRLPLLRIDDVGVGRHRVSTLTMGSGADVLLLHGLGGTRASFLGTAGALSHRYRVHAPDLPGFGSSSKPALASYDARWFARIMLGLMDELGIDRAHIVGNSMGGRVAIEVGLRWPERVGALALLCPAVAWLRRSFHPIVRLLRPEFGLLPHGFRRSIVTSHLRSIFCDEASIDPALADLAVDEFRRIYRSPWARRAFLASARNIYLDAPFGRDGFYPRLARLERPALFVWGSHDRVVPPAFGRHVRRWLPEAEQVTIGSCGHVPQIEHPAEINEVLMRFFARSERAAAGSRALPDSRAA